MEELQVFDKNLKRVGYLVNSDQVTRKRRINSDYELTFRVPMGSLDYTDKIQLKGHVMDERGQYYVINSRKRDRSGKSLMAVIDCMHVMFKLSDIKFPYSEYIDEAYGVNISTLTAKISAATGGKFTISVDDTFDLRDIKDWGRGNCLQALNSLLKIYGGEVEPDNFTIHIKKRIGNPASQFEYRVKKNIISSSFTDDARTLSTRIFAQMKDGLSFIGLSASNLTSEEYDLLDAIPGAIEDGEIRVNYLISPHWALWANDKNTFFDNEIIMQDIENPLELLEATRKALREAEAPLLDVRISPADLHKISRTEAPPSLGDTVQCVDPDMDMHMLDARIVDLTEYPFERGKHAEVTLANVMRRDYLDTIADLERSRRSFEYMTSGGKLRTDVFEAFARQAVHDINNSKTEVIYDARGIVLQSKSNSAHQVIHSSAGTILTTDGGATARVAITAQGIAAPQIIGILGEFAQVKTDSIIAGDALIASALIQSLKVEKLDASTAKITSAMIDTINANQINVGTLTGFTLQTAAAGQRIVQDINGLRSYDSTGRKRLSISPVSSSGYGTAGFEVFDPNEVYRGVIFGNAAGNMWVLGETGLVISSSTGITVLRDYVDFTAAIISGLTISKISGLDVALEGKANVVHDHGNMYVKTTGASQNIAMQYFAGGNYLEVFEAGVYRGRVNLV